MYQDRLFDARLGLELRQQTVHVVDVPGALHLGHHDDLDLVPDRTHDFGQIVQHPWRLKRVDARPKRRLAHVHLAAHLDQPGAGGLLAVH